MQIAGCLQSLHPGVVHMQTYSGFQMFIAFIQMFPFLHPNVQHSQMRQKSIRQQVNVCAAISLARLTGHVVISLEAVGMSEADRGVGVD